MKKNNIFFEQQKYLYLVFFLFFAQFMLLDIYYFDDLFRIEDGAFGWRSDGRALGGLFYKILIQFRSPLPDIYPLPLIVAGFLFCYMCHLFFTGFGIFDQKQQALLLLAIISSPFALSNWLFRYDSAFMLLSVGFALLPFYWVNKSLKAFFIAAILSLLGALTTYQISINIFIGLTAIYAFKLVIEQLPLKKILYFIAIAAIAFLTSYLIYSQVILRIMPMHSYAASFQHLPKTDHIANIIHQNLRSTWVILQPLLTNGLLFPLSIGILLNIICLFQCKSHRLYYFTIYCIALITTLFAIIGVMLIAPNNPFYARTFLGIIPLLIFPSLILLILKRFKLFYISIIFICITSLAIDRAALNAAASEVRLHDNIAQQIHTELSINKIDNIDPIMIIGKPKLSNAAVTNSKTFPIISQILPITFNDSYAGGRYVLMRNSFPKINYPSDEIQAQLKNQLDHHQPITNNAIYQLYYINGIPIIKFK